MAKFGNTDDSINNLYIEKFDPAGYVRTYCMDLTENDPQKYPYALRQEITLSHDIFKEGHLKGETMLDFGCGPSLLFSIIPSMYYKEVYYSDLVQGNRDYIRNWWQNKPGVYDFQPVFDFAAKALGKSTPWKEGPEMLRSKIKGIFAGNIHDPNVLEAAANPRQFDLVTNSLMLNAALTSDKDVPTAVKRLASLVKPGGHLIIYTHEVGKGQQTYPVEDLEFPMPFIKNDIIKAAMDDGDLHLLYWYEQTEPVKDKLRFGGNRTDRGGYVYDRLVYAVSYKE